MYNNRIKPTKRLVKGDDEVIVDVGDVEAWEAKGWKDPDVVPASKQPKIRLRSSDGGE